MTSGDDGNTEPPVVLPEAARALVLSRAAQRLGEMAPEEVPGPLRPFKSFAPNKRARHAAGPLAAALENEPGFRQQVAELARAQAPELAAAVAAGSLPPAASPAEAAALAYLLRPAGWRTLVAVASSAVDADRGLSVAADAKDLDRVREQLAAARAELRAAQQQHRAELSAARAEVADLRRRLREADERTRDAESSASAAVAEAERQITLANTRRSGVEAENRRLARQLTDAAAAAEAERRAAREGRSAHEVRLAVLVKALGDLAAGLRQELALPAVTERPADLVAEDHVAAAGGVPTGRGLSAADPEMLDALLAVAGTHLVVDGYNVTKTGYGEATLEAQRTRLIAGLAGLAAQTGAEVTVVFDGAEPPAVASPSWPRGVRVLFSPADQSADDQIRSLVAAEPAGRQVVVVSTDREVAEGVRRPGVWSMESVSLLRRLERT